MLPPEDEFNDLGHVPRGVLCFAGGDAETFGSANWTEMSKGESENEKTYMQSWR